MFDVLIIKWYLVMIVSSFLIIPSNAPELLTESDDLQGVCVSVAEGKAIARSVGTHL